MDMDAHEGPAPAPAPAPAAAGGHGAHGAPGQCTKTLDPTFKTVWFTYENAWVAPVVFVFFTLLLPIAFSLRMRGKRDNDADPVSYTHLTLPTN